MICWGVYEEVPLLWRAADASMSMMAIVNLIAILLLGKYAIALAKDFLDQLKTNGNPVFDPHMFPELKDKIAQDVWFDPNLSSIDKSKSE